MYILFFPSDFIIEVDIEKIPKTFFSNQMTGNVTTVVILTGPREKNVIYVVKVDIPKY
ncbi:hypothetical protein PFFCH_00398 [Plasmodium falciparum FCH/4]|uniref:Uncharacterized protein n=1 Tax=Plasmodium falciparum FCH/4 TaxID=1036724 RepID=A0A024VVB1_PLAFA|nr:hypothetical protein PFFCH_00398 [Plasmodium falciparum FCH/4]